MQNNASCYSHALSFTLFPLMILRTPFRDPSLPFLPSQTLSFPFLSSYLLYLPLTLLSSFLSSPFLPFLSSFTNVIFSFVVLYVFSTFSLFHYFYWIFQCFSVFLWFSVTFIAIYLPFLLLPSFSFPLPPFSLSLLSSLSSRFHGHPCFLGSFKACDVPPAPAWHTSPLPALSPAGSECSGCFAGHLQWGRLWPCWVLLRADRLLF